MDSFTNFVVTHPFICWAVVFCVLACVKLLKSGRRRRGQRIVKSLHTSQKIACKSGFRWRPVSLKSIPNVDHDYYEKVTAELDALGFRPLGDFEYLHLTEAYPYMRTAIRQFVCGHGQIYVGAYHMVVRGWKGWMSLLVNGTRQFHVIDFETALSDDRFVISTNANMPELSCPANLLKHNYPDDTEAHDLLERHIVNVNRALSNTPAVTPVTVTTLEEMMERQERQQQIGSQHRDEIGLLSEEESQQIQPDLSASDREALVAEAQRVSSE